MKRSLLMLGIAGALVAPPSARAEAPARMKLLITGKPAGEQLVRRSGRQLQVHFEFNDRGRGPKLDARYRLDAAGIPSSVQVKGLAYLKTKVDERFSLTGKTARWKNTSEDREEKLKKGAFYLTLDGPPEELAILARALLKARDRSLELLPAGRAHIETLTTHELGGQRLTLYALHGISLTPELLWLDEQQRFFGSLSVWVSLIREEAVKDAEELLKVQQAIERKISEARAERLTRRLQAPLLIRNVRAFDPAQGKRVGDSVLIDKGRIQRVGEGLKAPSGAEQLDGEGRFLMPGLWDMHVHLSGATDGLLHIGAGVTTVRDLANDNELLARRASEFESGQDVGPRILKAGFIDGSGPYTGPTKAVVDDQAGLERWIDRYAREGYVQLKLYSSLKASLVPLAIQRAHEKGLRVSGHVPVGLFAREFIEMGADELQHINFIFLNFLATAKDDTRTPLRFTLVAERGAELDLSGPKVRAFIELLKERRTVVDPTLATFEEMFVAQPGLPAPTYGALLHRLPATWQRRIRAGTDGLEAKGAQEVLRHRLAYERMVALVGLLHRAGVSLVAGTDAAAGLTYARELELYVQAGIPPKEVLKIATSGAAEVMGLSKQRGRLSPGQEADLILVEGDPSLLISDLRRVHTVVRGDRLFDAQALLSAAGLGPP